MRLWSQSTFMFFMAIECRNQNQNFWQPYNIVWKQVDSRNRPEKRGPKKKKDWRFTACTQFRISWKPIMPLTTFRAHTSHVSTSCSSRLGDLPAEASSASTAPVAAAPAAETYVESLNAHCVTKGRAELRWPMVDGWLLWFHGDFCWGWL